MLSIDPLTAAAVLLAGAPLGASPE